MLANYEFEGKTKEEAVKKACEELGVIEEQLEIEVLSYGSTGIFGLVGAKKAKIKVVLQETPEETPEATTETAEEKLPGTTEEAKSPGITKEERTNTPEEIDAVAETAKKALEGIISFIADSAKVSVAKRPNGISLIIDTGGNPAILIGKHGRTLDALQYLVRKIVRKEHKTKTRISFDVEGYRGRRKTSLTQLALRLGEKVKRSGRPATISPMNAYDRRIIHIALKNNSSVRTQSKGGGSFRELVILPQRKQKRSANRINTTNQKLANS